MPDNSSPNHNHVLLALGNYVTSFSGLLHALESSTAFMLTSNSNVDQMLVRALVADQTAYPVASKFFSVFAQKWDSILNTEDRKYVKSLKNKISTAIERRNRYMHDAWLMSRTSEGLREEEFTLARTRPHGGGVEFTSSLITVEVLERDSAELSRLANLVNALVFYDNPHVLGPNISNRFQIDSDGNPAFLPTE